MRTETLTWIEMGRHALPRTMATTSCVRVLGVVFRLSLAVLVLHAITR